MEWLFFQSQSQRPAHDATETGQPTRSGPPASWFGVRLTTSHWKNNMFRKITKGLGTGLIIWNGHGKISNRCQYGNWVDWAQDMDCLRALVNATLNLKIP